MQDNPSPRLPIMALLRTSYRMFFDQIKSHLVISYLFSLPFLIINISGWLNLSNFQPQNPGSFFTAQLMVVIALSFLLLTFLAIVYFRLFMMGPGNFLKISLGKLADIYGHMLIYGLMAAGLLLIALICLLLLSGLVVSIVTNILPSAPLHLMLNSLAVIFTLGLTLVISLRLQPSFISIAIGDRPLPFKSSWYYTMGHNRDIFLIGAGAIILPYICDFILKYITMRIFTDPLAEGQAIEFTAFNYFIFYLLSPVSLASIGLLSAASCVIRNHLVTENKAD